MRWYIDFGRTLQSRSIIMVYIVNWALKIGGFLLFPKAKTYSGYAQEDYENQSRGASDDCPNNNGSLRLLGGLGSSGLGSVSGKKIWVSTIPDNKSSNCSILSYFNMSTTIPVMGEIFGHDRLGS